MFTDTSDRLGDRVAPNIPAATTEDTLQHDDTLPLRSSPTLGNSQPKKRPLYRKHAQQRLVRLSTKTRKFQTSTSVRPDEIAQSVVPLAEHGEKT